MPLQKPYVDRLFARLSVRYGAEFMRQWPDIEPDVIKADWADVLDGVGADSIAYALRYLPEKPPSALRFKTLCNSAPLPEYKALPVPKADPELVKRVTHEIDSAKKAAAAVPKTDAQKAVEGILKLADKSGMTRSQREFCAVCQKMLSFSDPLLDRLAAHGVKPLEKADT